MQTNKGGQRFTWNLPERPVICTAFDNAASDQSAYCASFEDYDPDSYMFGGSKADFGYQRHQLRRQARQENAARPAAASCAASVDEFILHDPETNKHRAINTSVVNIASDASETAVATAVAGALASDRPAENAILGKRATTEGIQERLSAAARCGQAPAELARIQQDIDQLQQALLAARENVNEAHSPVS